MSTETESQEPLDYIVDLTGQDLSRPTPKGGTYLARITSFTSKRNKAGTGNNYNVTFSLENACTSTTDQPLKPGYKITKAYPRQAPADNPDSNMWAIALTRLYDAINKTTKATRPNALNFSNAVDTLVWITGEPKEDPQFGLGFEISKLEPYNS